MKPLDRGYSPDSNTFPISPLQLNCVQQLENISSYAFMKDKLLKKEVHLHAVWFHLDTASVHMLCRTRGEFIEVNEENYDVLLKEAEG